MKPIHLALLASLVSPMLYGQAVGTAPVWRTPFQEPVSALAGGNGVSVAVGKGGALYSAPTGGEWIRRSALSDAHLCAALWSGSQFIVAGEAGTILTSPDGASWTARASGTKSNLHALAQGGGALVATGDAGMILSSPDGITWTARSNSLTDRINDVAYGAGQFVAVTESGGILRSPDGSVWSAGATPAAGALSSIAFASGIFVAVGSAGEVLTSSDGIVWTFRRNGQQERLFDVAALPSGFIACGSGGVILTSADGITWNGIILEGGPLLVAVGQGPSGAVAVSDRGGVWISGDGSAWVQTAHSKGPNLAAAAAGSGTFVAVGSGGTILHSVDGSAWDQVAGPSDVDLTGVAYGVATGFVAVGANGTVLRSSDGLAWSVSASGVSTGLSSVCHGAAGFVAVGQHGLTLVSADGVSWVSSTVTGAKGDLLGVVYGGGLYVAVGQWGQVGTSPDGVTWTLLPGDLSTKERWYDLTGITYDGARFIVSARYATTFVSSDGLTWTKRSAAMVPGRDFHGVVATGGAVLAFGDRGMLESSADGLDWTGSARMTGSTLRGAAFMPGRVVFVGDGGVILASARGIISQPQDLALAEGASGTLSVQVEGAGPFSYQWYHGLSGDTSSPVPGATGASMTSSPGQAGGAYWVRVTDPLGFFDSSAAGMTVRHGWEAYHDTITQADNAAHVTSGNATTTLVNRVTGDPLSGVSIAFQITVGTSGGLKTDANSGNPVLGGDAAGIFGGVVGFGSNVWDLGKNTGAATITIAGIDPGKLYDVAVFATRDNFSSQTKFALGGAASFTAAHSAGSLGVGGNPVGSEVSIATGDGSTASGRVARWSNIKPAGTTLTVTVTSPNPLANSCILPQAFRIMESSETPVVTTAPSPVRSVAGNPATLSAKFAGTDLSYQWYQRNIEGVVAAVAGATSPTLDIPSLNESAEYFLRATGSGGFVDSPMAAVIATWNYAGWAAASGLPAGSETADSDADGIPNLVEFALGMDPLSGSQAPTAATDGAGNLVLAFSTTTEADGTTLVAEASTGMGGNSWTTAGVSLTKVGSPSIIEEQWEARAPLSGLRTFMRLRAFKN